MPILYSAVASDNNIVSKFASCDGNFDEIVEQVILKIPTNINKMTYSHGRYLLHYILDVDGFYFCITDKTCQRSRAFLFLNEIKRQYENHKSDFRQTLAQEMYRYNEDYSTIVIRSGELEELNSIGVDSSESILGEKLLFVENADNLRYTTISCIERKPQRVLISLDERNLNYIIIVLVIVAGLATIFFLSPSTLAVVVVILLLYAVKR
ncbi:vesicle-associated membrane protein 7-like [Colias croceus]|uniref:vesicle-associated membrane protein 7-like n=1 Tax=Colias crocea TaxID=72248 RepID=UPI001E2808DE|nr:vesicle-associated membrane protein 7-like [Colias croceus]